MAHMQKLADEALVPWRTNILELALDELANVLAHVDFADQIARLASVCHTFKATVAGATQARVAAARSLCDFSGASVELHRALDGGGDTVSLFCEDRRFGATDGGGGTVCGSQRRHHGP